MFQSYTRPGSAPDAPATLLAMPTDHDDEWTPGASQRVQRTPVFIYFSLAHKSTGEAAAIILYK